MSAYRELDNRKRYHCIFQIQDFFQPVTQHLDLFNKIEVLIRRGYLRKNPLASEYIEGLQTDRLTNLSRISGGDVLPPSSFSSFTLMGFSGVGKTTAINRVLSIYPQVILHTNPVNLTQVVWIKITCPHDGSLKTLCLSYLSKIDSILGTKYYERYGRKSISDMVGVIERISRIHCVGLIVIDEIQHLVTAKQHSAEQMMNFFVALINDSGVPVVLIGTMKAKRILQLDLCQSKRGSGIGDMVWERLIKGDDWDFIIEQLWQYQWLRQKVELTEELNDTIYDESQGIIDIAVKLFALSQARAIETGREEITPKLIRQVAKEDLQLVQPMLSALRSGNLAELEKYEDIMPMSFDNFLQRVKPAIDLKASIQKKKEQMEAERKSREIGLLQKVISSLIDLDVDEKQAEKLAKKVINENPELTLGKVVHKVLGLIEEASYAPKKQKTDNSKAKLQLIVAKGKKEKLSAYDALLREGYIKKPTEEFAI